MHPLRVYWLGRRTYRSGLAWQVWARQQVAQRDVLLLVEHTPVITIGTGGGWGLFRLAPERLIRQGIEIWQIGRGGKITYHGPGQLVGYPILDLRRHGRDVHQYLRRLEESLIRCCQTLGVSAHRIPSKTGIWVGNAKIASIGIRVMHWTTTHGFALNVQRQAQIPFTWIVPCGLHDPVTSLATVLGRDLELHAIADRYASAFAEVFGYVAIERVQAERASDPNVEIPMCPVASVPGAFRTVI